MRERPDMKLLEEMSSGGKREDERLNMPLFCLNSITGDSYWGVRGLALLPHTEKESACPVCETVGSKGSPLPLTKAQTHGCLGEFKLAKVKDSQSERFDQCVGLSKNDSLPTSTLPHVLLVLGLVHIFRLKRITQPLSEGSKRYI